MIQSATWPRWFGLASILAVVCVAASEPPAEPHVSSVFPPSGEPGKPFAASIRGRHLGKVRSLWFPGGGVDARVIKTETTANEDVVHAEVTFPAAALRGSHAFRIVTDAGVSNALELETSAVPALLDPSPAQPITRFPVAIFGRIANNGDVNSHRISVQAGQTLTFEVHSGFRGFDPAIAIAEQSGSWFDPDRVNPIASNDEPLFFPGLSTDARLVQHFSKSGEYLIRISSFSGQGGPDSVYRLSMIPGETPAPELHPHLTDLWEERQFTRKIGPDWLTEVASRGADGPPPKSVETFRAVQEGSTNIPVFTPPGMIEGRIEKPGETHVIQVRIDKAQDLAIEIETPEATLPRFNPVVRLIEPSGNEVVTNVYTKLNNNGLYMMKMIQAKAAFSLAAPGTYTLQIRDITTDCGGPDFRYRVLVRPQIAHAGKLTSAEDHINLPAGETRTLTVTLDREEEFAGAVALFVENLPAGVTAMPAMEKPVERPPLPNGGKLERYTAKPQTASLLLVAAPDAAFSVDPVQLHVSMRPVVKGQLMGAIPVADMPLMVVAGKHP